MLKVMDDEIRKQGRQIKELKRQVAASRDEELRIRAQTYWMRKVKDDEIQKKNRLIGELRSQMREKEEVISTAKAQLQSIVPQPQHLLAPTIQPQAWPVPIYNEPQGGRAQVTALLHHGTGDPHLIAATNGSQPQGPSTLHQQVQAQPQGYPLLPPRLLAPATQPLFPPVLTHSVSLSSKAQPAT